MSVSSVDPVSTGDDDLTLSLAAAVRRIFGGCAVQPDALTMLSQLRWEETLAASGLNLASSPSAAWGIGLLENGEAFFTLSAVNGDPAADGGRSLRIFTGAGEEAKYLTVAQCATQIKGFRAGALAAGTVDALLQLDFSSEPRHVALGRAAEKHALAPTTRGGALGVMALRLSDGENPLSTASDPSLQNNLTKVLLEWDMAKKIRNDENL